MGILQKKLFAQECCWSETSTAACRLQVMPTDFEGWSLPSTEHLLGWRNWRETVVEFFNSQQRRQEETHSWAGKEEVLRLQALLSSALVGADVLQLHA